jgi:glycosyltransferase involved in cell wall biosynthesis
MVKGLNVGKNILFLGPVSKEELQKIYASADLFVLPTLREGMPLVILEAASSGLPIITTKVSGIPEIVDDKSAIFVKRKDSKSLAKSIIKIIADQKKAKKMGKEARKKVLRLRKEIILKKYKNLYTNLG